jgi:hypothetical protein
MKGHNLSSIRVNVAWDDLNESKEDDMIVKISLEQSIKGYILTFNSLPPLGLWFNHNEGDPAKVEDVFYNGIENTLYIYMEFYDE